MKLTLPASARVLRCDGVLCPVGRLEAGRLIHGGDVFKSGVWAEVTAARDVGEIPVLRIGLESRRSIFLPPAQRVTAPDTSITWHAAELVYGYNLRAFVWGCVRVMSVESGGTTKCVELEVDGTSVWDPESDVVLSS